MAKSAEAVCADQNLDGAGDEAEYSQPGSLDMHQSVDLLQVQRLSTLTFSDCCTCICRELLCLQPFGVSEADIRKLKENNLFTLEAVARTCKRDLIALKGFGENKVDKIQKEGAQSCTQSVFK